MLDFSTQGLKSGYHHMTYLRYLSVLPWILAQSSLLRDSLLFWLTDELLALFNLAAKNYLGCKRRAILSSCLLDLLHIRTECYICFIFKVRLPSGY